MLCKSPISSKGGYHGCGQCLPCRIKKRREWTHRILLESALYAESIFVTLTYSDEHLPADRNLSVEVLQNFNKRLRYYAGAFRFFGVGEYGDEHGRPHYHLVIFGWPAVSSSHELLCKAWTFGFVDVQPLTRERAQYICGYVVKKMTDASDERLCGRHPEFRRSSLKPGIGKGMVDEIVAVVARYDLVGAAGDVPHTLRHGARELPLGRYLRRLVRLRLAGVTDDDLVATRGKYLQRQRLMRHARAPGSALAAMDAEMSELRAKARADKENPAVLHHLKASLAPQVDKLERRHKLRNRKKGKL